VNHTITEHTLDNGAKVLLVDVPDAPVMTFEINFRAGEYLVDRPKWETPHLMEHILLGANQEIRTARAFQAELERNGAYANASTNVYHISYEAECADFEWKRILQLLLLAITKPLFLESEFQAECGNVREELHVRGSNHFRRLNLAMREAYGLLAITDQERVALMENVELDDVRKHYRNTHTTSNMRVVIAGNVSGRADELLALFNTVDMPVGDGRIELPTEVPQRLDKALYIPNKTVDTLHLYVDTFCTPRLTENEQDALSLLNNMLVETLHSKIFGAARERGLVYNMGAGYDYTKDAGSWWFGMQVTKTNATPLLRLLRREIGRVKRGQIDAADIRAAKEYGLGHFLRGAQTVGSIGRGYSRDYFFDDKVEDYFALPERIKSVTKKQLVNVSERLFAEQIWGVGILGKGSQALADRLSRQIETLWD
jgi:predicted Zn-dependent peptidase